MRMMASRAPLVLAAALFVLGMAGLAQTVRQTGHGATPTPLTELAARPLVPSTLSPSSIAIAPTPMDAVSDVVAPSPPPIETPTRPGTTVFAPVPQPAAATAAATATATPEPTPEPRSAAIAAGVAADGDETVPASATTTPLHPLHFGMVANGEAAGTPAATATPTPEVTRTAQPAPAATGTPTP